MSVTVQGYTDCAACSEFFGDRHLADHQQYQPAEDGQCPTCPDKDPWRPRAGGDPPGRAKGGGKHADRERGLLHE
ncbi:hypothetical protein GKZ92_23245 (plasmid) [Gordonia sp. 135]|uniref:hypothetical protein n=1 Tax=Gordonia sp. 135 TaxID=2676309 RepID=UPI0012BB2962|nr:hypothetical protein [Gordonia sp. 135]QGP90628.1 hypothetical protein GKZ92_23245 [Gordonia sp. 135]